MKILMTQELFPPDISGGGETLSLKIAKGLIEKEINVKVLCSGNPNIKKYEGIETVRIPVNRYFMNFTIPNIQKHAKDADIIHTSSGNVCLPSWLTSKLLKKPICCYVHHIFGNNWIDVKGKILGNVFKEVESFFLNRSYDTVIFQNQLSKKIGIEIGIDRKRISMIQPGIDYKKFQIRSKKEPFVLFVGNFSMNKNMTKIKGLEYLIEAAKLLPEIEFKIVGEGEYLKELKIPKNITFTGGLKGEKLIRLYNKALIFCLPSLTEGFGLSLLEAMASGCSVISTINIGQKNAIIKPKNVTDIVKNIKYLIENQKMAKSIGNENRKIAKNFNWELFIEKLIKIYDAIV